MIQGGIFMDGGTVGLNPSPHGGVYAVQLIAPDNETVLKREVGYAHRVGADSSDPLASDTSTVGNNQAEFYAAYVALRLLPPDYSGYFYSDSNVTLMRLFHGWARRGIPDRVSNAVNLLLEGFRGKLMPCLLDGHPTKKHLIEGIGKRGYPVSVHQKWCDDQCKLLAESYLKNEES